MVIYEALKHKDFSVERKIPYAPYGVVPKCEYFGGELGISLVTYGVAPK